MFFACSSRSSQSYFGDVLLIPDRIASKWSLKMRIARSALLCRYTSGGKIW